MSSVPTQSGEKQNDESDVPRRLAAAICENKKPLRQWLNGLVADMLTGKTAHVREEIQELSEESPTVFNAVLLTLADNESFFEDLREAGIPDEDFETMLDLRDEYESLVNQFEAVFAETQLNLKNPSPTLTTTPNYNDDQEMPLMECALSSNELPLTRFRVPPSQALDVAETIIAHTGRFLQDLDNNDAPINAEEIENIQDGLEDIEEGLSSTRESFRGIDTSTPEADDVDGVGTDGGDYYFN